MSGFFMGRDRVDSWNSRVHNTHSLHMTVVDEHPVFNTEGKGREVDIQMVNATVAFYRGQSHNEKT